MTKTYTVYSKPEGTPTDFTNKNEAIKYAKSVMGNYPTKTQHIDITKNDGMDEWIGLSNNPNIKLDINY